MKGPHWSRYLAVVEVAVSCSFEVIRLPPVPGSTGQPGWRDVEQGSREPEGVAGHRWAAG